MSDVLVQLWLGGTEFELRSAELPELGADEVLVQLSAATVCGSDRHTVSGRRSSPAPSVLGHEGAGVVIASRREGVEAGQRVVFSVTDTCGKCERCRSGLSAKCTQVRKLGHELFSGSWLLNGTYATHLHVPAGQTLSVLPEQIPDDVAATAGCAVATVMATLEKAGRIEGQRVLINGAGMLGLFAAAAVRARGAAQVVAVDPNPRAQGLVAPLSDEVRASVPEDLRVDRALEFSGVPAGVDACIKSLDIGATAVLAGSVAPGAPVALDPEAVVRGWHTISGVHNYEPHHLHEAVDFLAQHHEQLPWEQILGRRYALAQLPEAFVQPPQGLREVILPQLG